MFVLTAVAFGLVAFIAWHPELWEPWLDAQGITRDDPVFLRGVKVMLVVVLGVPLTALIYAIGRLGSDGTQKDIHGYTVLRLKAGTLWFMTIACIGCAFLFFAYPELDPEAPHPWAFQAAGLFCLFCIPVFLNAKVRFDASTLSVSNSFGGRSTHHWADLVDVREVAEMKHYLFTFRNGKTARVSYSYAGLGELLETAKSKINVHAGTADGRKGR
ncbi:MAG: hypothetical protein JNK19_08535 [Tabrizicola sp.]|nr:hypothetical protein [Tabrizicola sp.]